MGQKLPVVFNPELPDTMDIRVLYPRENFKEYWQKQWNWLLRTAYMPLGIALGLCLLCSFAARSWTGVKFVIGSLPMVIFGWIGTLLDMFF